MAARIRTTRREFLKTSSAAMLASACCAGLSTPVHAGPGGSQIVAGAIRWDAWYRRSDASVFAQETLSSPRHDRRAPFFCEITADAQVTCIGSGAEMDAEIMAAAAAGLTYWAFDWYAADSSLRQGWNLYRASALRSLINWCGIVELGDLGSVPFKNDNWRFHMQEWGGYMREPGYQKLLIGASNRPLIYLLWDQSQLQAYFDGEMGNVKKAFDYLTEMLVPFSLGRPYVVLLDGVTGASLLADIGADAISNYIAGFAHEPNGRYRDLDAQTQAYWAKMSATGVPIVPIAMVGWDTRARQERPVPWEHRTAIAMPDLYYELPTPLELAHHVKSAVQFVQDHPLSCVSRALLIYSWDECDEGGGLIPTHGDPSGSYLSAIAPILRPS